MYRFRAHSKLLACRFCDLFIEHCKTPSGLQPSCLKSRSTISVTMSTLESLRFDNTTLRSLPIDPEESVYVRQVAGACFSHVKPTPVDNPQTVAVSLPALSLLNLHPAEVNRPEFAEYFCGNKILPGSETAAHCYCGHQFGYFSGQLGDGAAIYLGEILNEKDERWEIQLKGAGKTPYSRQADGRKVLRSSIREFLCSEAIHHLGIPTTRAGACVTSDSMAVRDIFYNGNAIHERCTNVLRIAPTFIRFGSFEIFKTMDPETGRVGPSVGRNDILVQLLDFTIKQYYPQIWDAHHSNKEEMYVEFYKEIVRRTACLVAEWQCVGWCHGVLNTDNMSIVGVTIDYGPFGFMDSYDPSYICNGSDDNGRYSYEKQPSICRWNCEKLAESIKGAVSEELTKPHLDLFDEEYKEHYLKKIRKKFGLLKKNLPEDKDLINSFLETMHSTGADFTNSFRCLSQISLPGSDNHEETLQETKEYLLKQCSTVEEMKKTCQPRMNQRQFQMMLMLLQTNPDLLSRLGGSQRQFMREIERMERMEKLKDMTQASKSASDDKNWSDWLSKYVERLRIDIEGSTADLSDLNKERTEVMDQNNPKFILRNYIAQNAIKAAEAGDFSEVQRVLRLLQRPFSEDVDFGDLTRPEAQQTTAAEPGPAEVAAGGGSCSVSSYSDRPPAWAADLIVT